MNPLTGTQRERVVPILSNPHTLATVLYAIALRQYGPEIHEWEPETVFLEFKDDFDVELPKLNHDKLMALLTAISTNSFYENWAAFSMICHSLNGDEDPLDMSDPLLPSEMAWAVTEVLLNDDTPGRFNDDVAAAVGRVLLEDGIVTAPAKLSFAYFGEKYEGSDTPGDLKREQYLSSEHHNVIAEYIKDQSATLIRQISALPWHDENTLGEMILELQQNG